MNTKTDYNGITRTDIGTGPNVLRSPIAYEKPQDDANLSAEFIQCFRKYPNNTLIVDSQTGLKWSGSHLLDATSRIATHLVQKLNLGPKKNIALLCDHSDREVVFSLGCFIAGCSIYPQNPDDGLEEIKTVCTMIQVDAIATQSKHHQLVHELRKCLPSNVPIIWVEDQSSEPSSNGYENDGNNNNNNNNNNDDDSDYKRDLIERDGVILLDEILFNGAIDTNLIERLGKEMIKPKECPGYYMLTSGSTGYPKVVEMMQWGVINCGRSMFQCARKGWNGAGQQDLAPVDEKALERMLPIGSDSVIAGDLPLDHGAGLCFIIMSMMLGAKYVVVPIDDLDKLCQAIDDYRIDVLINGSTKVFQFMKKLKEDFKSNGKTAYDATSLRYVCTVGAKCNYVPLIREVESLYPNLQMTQSYGLTEVGYVTTLPLSEARKDIQSVGWLFPGVLAIVVDSDGNQLGPNERGELHVWSESLFNKYLCRKGIDANQALKDCHDSKGYYNTGDLVHYDEDGKLFIHGRIKETLMLRNEWKIMPAELESIVNQHPLIESSIIVGIPHPEIPEVQVPKAFVKLIGVNSEKYLELVEKRDDEHNDKLLTAYKSRDYDRISKDIFNFAASKTAEVKHLTGGVKILEDYPRNGRLQKIDRKVLRQM